MSKVWEEVRERPAGSEERSSRQREEPVRPGGRAVPGGSEEQQVAGVAGGR